MSVKRYLKALLKSITVMLVIALLTWILVLFDRFWEYGFPVALFLLVLVVSSICFYQLDKNK